MSQSVIIIGGGVVGASCAYYLQQRGARRHHRREANFRRGMFARQLRLRLSFACVASRRTESHSLHNEGDAQPEVSFLNQTATRREALDVAVELRPTLQRTRYAGRRSCLAGVVDVVDGRVRTPW
jgi:cation diffusion facilitator CzcD-associated flavoprotein CzcO